MLQAAKRSKKKSTSKAAATADSAAAGEDVYNVPEEFDPAVLGQPDFSSREDAERTMANLFVKRWWDLWEQVGHLHPCLPLLQYIWGYRACNTPLLHWSM